MTLSLVLAGFLGGNEWIIILLAIVLLFGGRKIPELMRGLGKGIREFRNSSRGLEDETPKVKEGDKKEE
ncbi:MAG: twin-arginine translocase TatA/TatE family subunit [Bacteroidales bacterium]|jgi:sec-independent protein translocase protein TatA|nr:twin-arginine translocase TatA/TatE family subunit [Bacteroidales bacterium]MDD2569611.1 twin-arginine translocase TatA/TatE family subunit [Bacteroidales bacterium]MDD2812211.1 twin-arginine translocase TatA/TatE family subunit [Bacteroidales bacterium]MDD3384592.1 twin-arginine translocase TatA/TatE family subunit [Bacteroidales bacterium]MDD3811391.1 twin-arginine translocase TatA/TatE family subunit [Bacteroidales bacterium]